MGAFSTVETLRVTENIQECDSVFRSEMHTGHKLFLLKTGLNETENAAVIFQVDLRNTAAQFAGCLVTNRSLQLKF